MYTVLQTTTTSSSLYQNELASSAYIVVSEHDILFSYVATYSHGQELFYKFVSKITNKLVKQLLSMTVHVYV